MIKGLHHVGIVARDVEKLVNFYRDVIGLREVDRTDWQVGSTDVDRVIGVKNSAAKSVMMTFGNVMLEFFQYLSPEGEGDPAKRGPWHRGYAHLCLSVDDIDHEYARLCAAGMTSHGLPPRPALNLPMRSIYMRDPEGNIIELLEIQESGHPYNLVR
jgi:catechol 2,3-dioxygenase-like lactoylglutathione lyase family enzyme